MADGMRRYTTPSSRTSTVASTGTSWRWIRRGSSARPKIEKEGPPDPYVEEAESVPTVALEPRPAKDRRRRRSNG